MVYMGEFSSHFIKFLPISNETLENNRKIYLSDVLLVSF